MIAIKSRLTGTPLGTIDFDDYAIGVYGNEADTGIATVEDGGATLHITGNAWKQISFPYVVTADTILEFDYRSPTEGEIHGIGFDNTVIITPGVPIENGFQLYGTQTTNFLIDFNDYEFVAPLLKHYVIPVGQYYTGSVDYLFFVNDHDAGPSDAEGYFSNVRVYDSPDTDPPLISNVQSSAVSSSATISWTTDEPASSRVEYGTTTSYGSTTSLDPTLTTGHSVSLTGLTASTTYYFRVHSIDAAGNVATSSQETFATTTADATPPTVSVTLPTNAATVSGQVTVTADASDNVGVSQVEFKLDGDLIDIDTTAPYSISWNTLSVTNASHSLTAVAHDAAGNMTTSAAVTVTVDNSLVVINVTNAATLTTALNNATGGETILLANGDYGSFSIQNKAYGSYVTVQSLSGKGGHFDFLEIDNSSYVRIKSVDVAQSGGTRLIHVEKGSHHIEILDSEVYQSPGFNRSSPNPSQVTVSYGIQISNSTDVLVQNNSIHDVVNGLYSNASDDISVIGNTVDWTKADDFKFGVGDGLLIEDNIGTRFRYPDVGAHNDFIQFQGAADNITILGNLSLPALTQTTQGIFLGSGVGNTATYNNVLIENNIMYVGNARGISVHAGTGITARYNTVLTPPTWGSTSANISLPSGSTNELNIKGHNDNNSGISGTNHTISYDNPNSTFYYNDYYLNAMAGAGITIEDLQPVNGSPAETVGAFARINELLGL